MKTKSKFNILLVAICGLLIVLVGMFGRTTSYLTTEHEIKMTAVVANINITLIQYNEAETSYRELNTSDNAIYLNTTVIEGDETYTTNVKLKNSELSSSYYIRYKVVALVNGVAYNINDYITVASTTADTKFYLYSDGWMYYGTATEKQVLPGATDSNTPLIVSMLKSFSIPTTAEEGKLSTSTMQGKNFELFLYVEGSPTTTF